MKFQRTPFGLITGTFLLIITCVGIALLGAQLWKMGGIDSEHFMIVAECLCFALWLRIYLFISDFAKTRNRNISGEKSHKCIRILTVVLLIFFFAACIVQIFFRTRQGEADISSFALTYDYPEVASYDASLAAASFPLTSLYVGMLRFLFSFLGNKAEVVFAFRTILQTIAGLFMFIRVRREAGKIAGLYVLIGMGILPFFIGEEDILSANTLAAVFATIILLFYSYGITGLWEKREKRKFLWAFGLSGVLGGFLGGYHPAFIAIFLSGLIGIWGIQRKGGSDHNKGISFGVFTLGWLCGLAASVFLIAYGNQCTFAKQFFLWVQPFENFSIPQMISVELSQNMVFDAIILILSLYAALHFICHKVSIGMVDAFMLILLSVYQFLGKADSTWGFLLCLLWINISGYGIFGFIDSEKAKEEEATEETAKEIEKNTKVTEEPTEEVADDVTDAEDVAEEEEIINEPDDGANEDIDELEECEDEEDEQEEKDKEIKFIPNPLPLPKEHERKEMDFLLDASDDDDYLVDISDRDDFDIL